MAQLVPWSKSPLVKGDIPVAIISLEDAKARRSALIDRGFPPELVDGFWPACDMRNLSETELQAYSQYHDIEKIYGRLPISAELGCLFSHSEIIKWLSRQDAVSQVIIFEDDVIPNGCNSFQQLCSLAASISDTKKPGQPVICHLGPKPEQWKSSFVRRISRKCKTFTGLKLFDLIDKRSGLWRAHAYVINKPSAVRYGELADKTGFLADDWRFISEATKSRIVLVDPPLFIQDEEVASTIDPKSTRGLINSVVGSSKKEYHLGAKSFSLFFFRISRLVKRILKVFLARMLRALPPKQL